MLVVIDDFMGTPAFKLNKSCGSITPFSNKVFKSLLEALVICVLASASGASYAPVLCIKLLL